MPGSAKPKTTSWHACKKLGCWRRKAKWTRLPGAALVADSVSLDTVVNNIMVTNNLELPPGVHVRVMLTSPLETFTVGHTIIISRGLLDVLGSTVICVNSSCLLAGRRA